MDADVFDSGWLARAEERPPFWANEAPLSVGAGARYLDSLRLWFGEFPSSRKDKRALRVRLESFDVSDHLGAVNELSWWRLMWKAALDATPVPTGKGARPDFVVMGQPRVFVEVSTLNVSQEERAWFASGEGVAINHGDVLRRLLLKATGEKAHQIRYAAGLQSPCWLVIFDYTVWSSFGTARVQDFADHLLGPDGMFRAVSKELAGIVYVERQVVDGKIGISLERSASYHNPYAGTPTPELTFGQVPSIT